MYNVLQSMRALLPASSSITQQKRLAIRKSFSVVQQATPLSQILLPVLYGTRDMLQSSACTTIAHLLRTHACCLGEDYIERWTLAMWQCTHLALFNFNSLCSLRWALDSKWGLGNFFGSIWTQSCVCVCACVCVCVWVCTCACVRAYVCVNKSKYGQH